MNPSDPKFILQSVDKALASGMPSAEVRVTVLGKKGTLTALLRQLGDLPIEERKERSQVLNAVKTQVEELLSVGSASKRQPIEHFDPTLPPYESPLGRIHPIPAMIDEMVTIFQELSFEVVEGNELVTDEANFESLNMDIDHPARDGQDSFYLSDSVLLRTQTTAQQVLEMRQRFNDHRMPIRVVVPGKTYRRESDQTHDSMFHQIDAVMVDTETTFADLKGSLEYFVTRLFGDTVETRFRPHHFPFTEPSAEVDIRIKNASGTGKHTRWLEMLGCGMIHPNVLKRAGLNPKIYRGWAFGTSVERPIMIRQQIPDIRFLTRNDARFIRQTGSLPC